MYLLPHANKLTTMHMVTKRPVLASVFYSHLKGELILLCVCLAVRGDLYREVGRMQARLRIGTAPARVGVFKSLGCNKLSCTPFAHWETALSFLDG